MLLDFQEQLSKPNTVPKQVCLLIDLRLVGADWLSETWLLLFRFFCVKNVKSIVTRHAHFNEIYSIFFCLRWHSTTILDRFSYEYFLRAHFKYGQVCTGMDGWNHGYIHCALLHPPYTYSSIIKQISFLIVSR